jgi:hypothetical protein
MKGGFVGRCVRDRNENPLLLTFKKQRLKWIARPEGTRYKTNYML